MTVSDVIINVCLECNFFISDMEVCAGEVLPIDRAIQRNAAGKGCCDKVKEYIKEQKNE